MSDAQGCCVNRLRRLLTFGLLLLLFASEAYGQAETAGQIALTPQEQLRKTVGFIEVPYKDQAGQVRSVKGTCFFVFVPDERLGKDRGYGYVVTNRHVAMPEAATTLEPEVYITINYSTPHDNQTLFRDIVPLNGKMKWYLPADATVDLAVLPFIPSPDVFDIKTIPISLFATSEVLKTEKVDIGDAVIFIGFFFQFPGATRIEPIYRQGVIAMMPEDPIRMSDGQNPQNDKLEHLYMADAHAFHGNSGSPLFVQTGGMRNGSLLVGSRFRLIGVVNGFIQRGE